MSSMKKRLAKGLGASALAVATVTSGLSLEPITSAAASGSDDRSTKLGSVLGTVDLVLRQSSFDYAAPTAGFSTPSGTSYGRDIDVYRSYGSVAAANSKYTVIDSGNKDGRFALRAASGSCLVMNAVFTNEVFRTPENIDFTQTEWRMRSGQPARFLQPVGSCTTAPFSFDGTFLSYNGNRVGMDKFVPGQSGLEERRDREWANGRWQPWGSWYNSIFMNVEGWGTGGTALPLAGDVAAMLPGPKAPSVTASFSEDRDAPAVVTVKGQPGADVEIKEGTTVVARGRADGSGLFSYEVPAPNDGSRKTFTATQTVDGKTSEAGSAALQYSQVSITSPADQAETDEPAVVVEGTGEAGSSVVLTINGAASDPITVASNGTWSLEVELGRGENTITATQQSKGANTTSATVVLNPGVPSIAPLVIETPTDGSTVETTSNRIEFAGVGEPGARVEITTQGTNPRTIVNVIVGADGTWSQLGANLAFGVPYVLDTVYTPQGAAATTGTHRVTLVDADPGVTQPFAFTTPADNSEVIAPDNKVRLAGAGTTGTTVTIWAYQDKKRVVGTATVDKAGRWEIPAGMFNNQNTRYEMHVEYTAPGRPTQSLTHTITVKSRVGVERPFDFTTPAEGSTVIAPDNRVDFSGTGTTGTEITIWNYRTKDRPVATATVDAQGNWNAVGLLDNTNGEYRLHVEYTEPGKQTMELTRHIYIKAEASTERPFEAVTPAEGSTVALENGRTLVEGFGTTGGKVKVWNWHDKDRIVIEGRQTLTVDENGKWSGVGEFAAQPYGLHIEYFAPGVDTEGEPTQVITRGFTATAGK